MGIRGLTTYISCRSDKYLEDYKLRDCQLVIDGNSLLSQLYVTSLTSKYIFGGDYFQYANSIREFFLLLKKCDIKPFVLLDGGYEIRKLKTVLSRIKEKIRLLKYISPRSHQKVFPALLKVVFKNVLEELGIPFAQCLFEADEEIAAIARHLECPVLSYDSDFYVYDVLYIPFPTLIRRVYKDVNSDSNSSSSYLSCKLYRIEHFLKQFGGLKKQLLPLLGPLLGNDYIRRGVFADFVSHLKRPKSRGKNYTQRYIAGLIEWLRKETLETATFKLINRLSKKKRHYVAEHVKRILSLYVHCSSELLPVLGIESKLKSCVTTDTSLSEQTDDINKSDSNHKKEVHEDLWESNVSEEKRSTSDDDDDDDSEDDDNDDDTSKLTESEEDDTKIEDQIKKHKAPDAIFDISKLPQWFIDDFHKGKFPPAFMDMITLHLYFIPPQIEDSNSANSHAICLPIISAIYGLLTVTSSKDSENLLCYSRPNIIVSPVSETCSVKFPPLEDLLHISLAQRTLILFETLGLTSTDQELLSSYPSTWQLYLSSVIFWVRNTKVPTINTCHVFSVIFCLLTLDVISRNIRKINGKKLCKKKKSLEKKEPVSLKQDTNVSNIKTEDSCTHTKQEINENVCSTSLTDTGHAINDCKDKNGICEITNKDVIQQCTTNIHEPTVCEALAAVSVEECVHLKNILSPWHNIDTKIESQPKQFCISTVHSFSQLQSCLLHIMYLNSLLGQPVPNCHPEYAFSGTFLYNVYCNFRSRSSILQYMTQLLTAAPSILALYKCLCNSVITLLPDLLCVNKPKGKTRRKKTKHKKQINVEEGKEQSQSTDTDFEDMNNRFAVLNCAERD